MQGVSWQVGETAAVLIREKKLPPFLVVAVDSPGPYRSLNLLPYKPGSGQGGFRGDWCVPPVTRVIQYPTLIPHTTTS